MIGGSIFSDVQDRHPNPFPPVSFGELVEALVAECYDADPADKTEQPCVSPATYPAGSTRGKASAISWDWFAADIDNKSGNQTGSTIDDIVSVMAELNSPWFIYTTASSRPDAHCFRLMFPLDRPILHSEFDAAWLAFSRILPMDAKTKDISRLFIVPRKWANRVNRMERRFEGVPVPVDEIVRRYHAPTPQPHTPSIARPTVSESLHFANPMRSIHPSLNAPYVPKDAVNEAMSASVGGRMYRFLIRVAFRALRMGYGPKAGDLEAIGLELAVLLGRERSDIRRDAESAYRYAQKHASFCSEQHARLQVAIRPKRFRAM